jgi:hypothetical protein
VAACVHCEAELRLKQQVSIEHSTKCRTPTDEIKAFFVVTIRKQATNGAVEQRVHTVADGNVTKVSTTEKGYSNRQKPK